MLQSITTPVRIRTLALAMVIAKFECALLGHSFHIKQKIKLTDIFKGKAYIFSSYLIKVLIIQGA